MWPDAARRISSKNVHGLEEVPPLTAAQLNTLCVGVGAGVFIASSDPATCRYKSRVRVPAAFEAGGRERVEAARAKRDASALRACPSMSDPVARHGAVGGEAPTWVPTCTQEVASDGTVFRGFDQNGFMGDMHEFRFSSDGRVWRSTPDGGTVEHTPTATSNGYLVVVTQATLAPYVSLMAELRVHRAVAWLWGRPTEGRWPRSAGPAMRIDLEAHHEDNDPLNNAASNLVWVTATVNKQRG